MHVVGAVGQKRVVVIGEQSKIVLDSLLFDIRYHFGIDTPFEQDFAVLGIDDLGAVIGQDETSV